MRFLYRLRWDNLVTPWQPVKAEYLSNLRDAGRSLTLRVDPPTDWQFDLEMLNLLDGRIAVESTFVAIEFQTVK